MNHLTSEGHFYSFEKVSVHCFPPQHLSWVFDPQYLPLALTFWSSWPFVLLRTTQPPVYLPGIQASSHTWASLGQSTKVLWSATPTVSWIKQATHCAVWNIEANTQGVLGKGLPLKSHIYCETTNKTLYLKQQCPDVISFSLLPPLLPFIPSFSSRDPIHSSCWQQQYTNYVTLL